MTLTSTHLTSKRCFGDYVLQLIEKILNYNNTEEVLQKWLSIITTVFIWDGQKCLVVKFHFLNLYFIIMKFPIKYKIRILIFSNHLNIDSYFYQCLLNLAWVSILGSRQNTSCSIKSVFLLRSRSRYCSYNFLLTQSY